MRNKTRASIPVVLVLSAVLNGCEVQGDQEVQYRTDLDQPEFGLALIKDGENCDFWIQTWSDDTVISSNWSGDCENGLATGTGKLEVEFQTRLEGRLEYSGSMSEGYMDGKGELNFERFSAAGDRYTKNYVGLWDTGNRTGLGKQTHRSYETDGGFYEQFWAGNFDKNSLSGFGIHRTIKQPSSGERTIISKEGQFAEHKLNGLGLESIRRQSQKDEVTSSQYRGHWSDGQKSGSGVLVETSNTGNGTEGTYHGNWQNGSRSGHGIQYFDTNDHFKGSWNDGQPSLGQCILLSENYSGACKLFHYPTSSYSGEYCLAAKKGKKHCFDAWRSRWVS